MTNKAIFRLKRNWVIDGKTVDLYEEIKAGRKNIEYRDASPYWLRRLCSKANFVVDAEELLDLTQYLRVHRTWFIVGFAKGNVPRLEATITKLLLDSKAGQLQIHFQNVEETTQE